MIRLPTFSSSGFRRVWFGIGLAALLSHGTLLAADPPPKEPAGPDRTTNAPTARATPTNAPAVDFQALARLVADRNIFDPERQPRTPGAPRRVAPKPRQVDAPEFGLVGIMNFSKGTFAFFDGNAADYKKAVGPNGTIAGHTVTRIGGNTVTLLDPKQKPVELKIGTRLRREGQSDWQVSVGSTNAFVSRSGSEAAGEAGNSAGEAGGDAANEILKRLLKKREQEMK